jgi:hypothetical protein
MADASSPTPVRAVCADALASLDSRGVGETAAAILRGTEDVDLVAACLRLLRPPATEAQREVVRRLCSAEDDVVRGQAVACMARIGRPEDMETAEPGHGGPLAVGGAQRGAGAGVPRRRRAGSGVTPC